MAALAADPGIRRRVGASAAERHGVSRPAPPTLSIALTQLPQGWRIAALAATPKQQPIVASQVNGRLDLAAEQSGDVVSMADPDTGATLLIGTQRRPGQGGGCDPAQHGVHSAADDAGGGGRAAFGCRSR